MTNTEINKLKNILIELQLEIKKLESLCNECDYALDDCISRAKVNDIIQQRINTLKKEREVNKND